jgi:hypothetical protein
MTRAQELAKQLPTYQHPGLGRAMVDEACEELLRLDAIEAAARNLVKVKGRYHTEQAFKALAALLVNADAQGPLSGPAGAQS